jgi:threonine dehydrogenase-like Zn-dependent dehydrogenase
VPGTVLGHEGVGVVEEVGKGVRNLKVVRPRCSFPRRLPVEPSCTAGRATNAQCDEANPNGKESGTAFFGGPKDSGPFDGLRAEYARVPLANVGLVRLPEEVSDDRAILISDIFPTGEIANVHDGYAVVVFGCGPVGQFAVASCRLMGAGRIICGRYDCEPTANGQRARR